MGEKQETASGLVLCCFLMLFSSVWVKKYLSSSSHVWESSPRHYCQHNRDLSLGTERVFLMSRVVRAQIEGSRQLGALSGRARAVFLGPSLPPVSAVCKAQDKKDSQWMFREGVKRGRLPTLLWVCGVKWGGDQERLLGNSGFEKDPGWLGFGAKEGGHCKCGKNGTDGKETSSLHLRDLLCSFPRVFSSAHVSLY